MQLTELARAARVSVPRMHFIEASPRITCKVATKVATALVRMASEGADLRAVAEDWPLFHLLVPVQLLDVMFADGSAAEHRDVGQEE